MSLVHGVKEGWSGGRGWTRGGQGAEKRRVKEKQRERENQRERESWLAFRGVGGETVGEYASSRGRGDWWKEGEGQRMSVVAVVACTAV